MVICIIALAVFAILGIFSAKYRKLAKEAADCTFKKLTLKPCDTGLDIRLKSHLTAKLMNHPKTAKFVHNNFDMLMSVLFIIMIASMAATGYYGIIGVYNYAQFGNCNGENSDGFCAFEAIATAHPSQIGNLSCVASDCKCITSSVNCTITGKDSSCNGATCTCPK